MVKASKCLVRYYFTKLVTLVPVSIIKFLDFYLYYFVGMYLSFVGVYYFYTINKIENYLEQ